MELTNKKVVVIGGSSGIGLGIAEACLAKGAEVTIVGRSAHKLESVAGRYPMTTIQADAGEEGEVQRVFGTTGVVDHVVLTAVYPVYQPVRELEIAEARRTLASKIIAPLLVAKHARFAEDGSLVLTAGIAMDRPGPNGSVIAATNGALPALARALSLELAPVRVNVLSPGWVDTPVWDQVVGAAKEQRFAQQAAKLPVRRIGKPSDIASAAVFLMTNGFTTGEVLHVDGGHRLV